MSNFVDAQTICEQIMKLDDTEFDDAIVLNTFRTLKSVWCTYNSKNYQLLERFLKLLTPDHNFCKNVTIGEYTHILREHELHNKEIFEKTWHSYYDSLNNGDCVPSIKVKTLDDFIYWIGQHCKNDHALVYTLYTTTDLAVLNKILSDLGPRVRNDTCHTCRQLCKQIISKIRGTV
ncbi:hypothetical protein [Phthorimaea operculella granulovirus]|uniref:Uncharacterized protein n=1 Tax=Phthorimaea operculella granulovirus TaxID=192584 RepID=Q8JRY5_9BBAC|nr:hypothetical protein [Phthorimaea operculella granulovirus]AAM70272.1 hypothetical protein [Phthorimaea operculella granulovirus]ANY57463.1 hypothetical protein PhopGVgp074 [Phthorimaea operculella granulovirus]QBH65909.1 hypothetical protein PhopGVgp074 [Phthorimaea operculella granulovirus]QBH66039.1 hypothetical protein PhopGVgp074 [Phthorimaea operculella granulovirus]QBH66169.1 hypothetical protein PhopGVgp074 [Phthorimaea operculella granulovirus]